MTPTRLALWQKLHMQLTTLCTELALNSHWYQLWWMGLTHPNDPNTHTINLYPPHFHPIHQGQQAMGWQQLYYGWLSKQWTQYLVNHHPKLDPLHILAKMLGLMWHHILDVWKSHNDDHHSATLRFPPNMVSDLHGIYAARDHLPLHIQDHIFNLIKEELLRKSPKYIQTWIQHTKSHIQTELKISAKQRHTNTQVIRQFFPTR